MGQNTAKLCDDFVIVGECCHPEDEMRDVAGSHFRDAIVNGQFLNLPIKICKNMFSTCDEHY